MAASPFTKLPSEMVCAITNLIDVEELLEFRLVCRWAERESFSDFATRGLRDVAIEVFRGKTMPSRLKAIEDSLQFASVIKSMRARLWESESDLVKDSTGRLVGDQRLVDRHDNGPTLSYMVSRLPKLESLSIEHLTGPKLDLHILPDPDDTVLQAAWWRLRILNIEYGHLSSIQWLSLIHLVSPTLTDLCLYSVVCNKGGWLPVLMSMQETLPALTSLKLEFLSHLRPIGTNTGPLYVDWYLVDRLKTTDELGELEEGTGTVSLGVCTAEMQGRQAVRLGLERIVRYRESVEEALSRPHPSPADQSLVFWSGPVDG
ncbi:hypothetical protein LTR97_007461 [Elasticomyces elasticus]|uniref:F-box domain-containing protein n=1 Tax=Elasticomyces elasticus TaxID=574655 RepID=A0AAN7W8C5_9PEZI|nr:hypothetical protein LTR97_007461 [Elasticomyces elasticus]